jgi:hypothetical protein
MLDLICKQIWDGSSSTLESPFLYMEVRSGIKAVGVTFSSIMVRLVTIVPFQSSGINSQEWGILCKYNITLVLSFLC